jgi:hypothetical protein
LCNRLNIQVALFPGPIKLIFSWSNRVKPINNQQKFVQPLWAKTNRKLNPED